MFSRSTLFLCLLPILLAFLYQPLEDNTVSFRASYAGNPGRTLLVTAHPDDESYFFAPTLLALLSRKESNQERGLGARPSVYSLCLSTGDADGLGKRRADELNRSLDVLGVDKDKRWLIAHPYVLTEMSGSLLWQMTGCFLSSQLQDDITLEWDPRVIAEVVEPYITQHHIDTVRVFLHLPDGFDS